METIDKELEKKRNRKIEKIKNLFKSLGKQGTPFDPETIKDKCWDETEDEYQKKQKEWLKQTKKS